MSLFICLEGLCGVGKTAIAETIAEQSNMVLFPTIPAPFDEMRNIFNSKQCIDSRFSFFVSAVFYASFDIQKALESGTNVIVESYFYRTIAFHKGMGANLDIQIGKDIVQPTHCFLLTCDNSTRLERIRNRSRPMTLWDTLAEISKDRILTEYQKFDMVIVDTSDMGLAEVSRTVLSHIFSST